MSCYELRPNGERITVLAAVKGALVPLGYQQLAIGTGAASGLTPPAGARLALLQAEGAALRYRDSGGAPTVAIGMRLVVDGSIHEYLGNMASIRFIAEGAGAFLNVSYYG